MNPPAAEPQENAPRSVEPRARYILIAEGDIVRAASLFEILEAIGVGALVARNGIEAIQLLEQFGPPMVMIIAISLAGRDAFAVMTALRSVADRRRAGIILMAPGGDRRRVGAGVRGTLGISAVLPTNASAAVLRIAIDRALAEAGSPVPDRAATTPTPEAGPDVTSEILRDVTGRATRLTRAPGAVAYLQIGKSGHLRTHMDWISEGTDCISPFDAPYALEWVLKTGDTLVLPDLSGQSFRPGRNQPLHKVLGGLVAVPLRDEDDRVIGALCVFDVKPMALDDTQLSALKALGREYGPLLEGAAFDDVDAVGSPSALAVPPSASTPSAAAIADPVTGLPTWESGRLVLDAEIVRAQNRALPISLIVIEIDRFGALEDARNRDATDQIVRSLGRASTVMLRTADITMRWGRAGFLFALPAVSISTARDVAERIRAAAQKMRARDVPEITVSGGVTELPPGGSLEAAIDRLSEQLLLASKRGGNRVC